jgi:hypothetical protein
MKNFLKRYWFLFIFPLGFIPAIFFGIKEEKLKTYIYSQALDGNKRAVNLLKIHRKPWTLDNRLIRAALSGNKNAQDVLQIEENK